MPTKPWNDCKQDWQSDNATLDVDVDVKSNRCDSARNGARLSSAYSSFITTTSGNHHNTDDTRSTNIIPDGGLWAWLQVLSGFMLYLNAWGMVTAFGCFQDYYASTYIPSSTNSAISWIGTLQGFLLAVTSVFAGPILDRGYPRALILSGTFFVVFGMMMTSLCESYWQLLLAQGICVGVGAGQLFIVAVGVIPNWFSRKRAFATGIAAAGSSVGGIIYPIVFRHLLPKIGFYWTVRIMGFVALATNSISFTIARLRTLPPPRPKIVDFSGFSEISFALFWFVSFLGTTGLYIPFFYITEYTVQRTDAGPRLAAYMLPILSAGSIVGRILPAFLADHLGPLNVLSTCTVFAGVLAYCWIVVNQSVPGLIVWSLLYGAFSGAFVSLQTPTIASITSDMRIVGGRMGVSNLAAGLGVLIGNPIAGALHQSGGWISLQAFCGATLLVTAMLALVTRVHKTGSPLGIA